MIGYQAVAKILAAEGVEFISAFPHQSLIDACAEIGVRPVICRQERVGVNIADGFARITNGRRLAAFTMQAGPGAENAFPGVAQAFADSVPYLHLAGGGDLLGNGVPPRFNAVATHRPITKWAAPFMSADGIAGVMRHAVGQLRHGRLGPVLLEMDGDVMASEVGADVDYQPVPRHRSAASAEDVRDLVRALLAVDNPVIYAGQGVLYAEAAAALVAFAELAQVPVLTTLAGKSAFPETHALALGTGGNSKPLTASRFLEETDFVLAIGSSLTRNPFTTPIPAGTTVAQVTNCGEDIGKDYPVVAGAVGDAQLVLEQLAEEYARQDGPKQRGDGNDAPGRVAAVRSEYDQRWAKHHVSDETPISPYRVFHDVAAVFDPAKSIVTHDSGYPRDQLVPFWKAPVPRGYIGWGKSTQLGYSLGLAMGAKLAAPERHVINFMGDAAFGMTGLDVETAVRAEVPIVTVVLNNGHLTGYDKLLPIASQKYAANQMQGRYADVAAALGAHAERVETPDGLIPALERAKVATAEGRPAVVEAMTKVETEVPEKSV